MPPDDPVKNAFLHQQLIEARELERRSPLMNLSVDDDAFPQSYMATFFARGLVEGPDGVREADSARFCIRLPDEYLKDDIDLAHLLIVSYAGPHPHPFHPQILPFHPYAVCMGMAPGTPVTALIRGAYEIWCYQLFSTSDNGLNPRAASWARRQAGRFPVDTRPLTGRRGGISVRARRGGNEGGGLPEAACDAPFRKASRRGTLVVRRTGRMDTGGSHATGPADPGSTVE